MKKHLNFKEGALKGRGHLRGLRDCLCVIACYFQILNYFCDWFSFHLFLLLLPDFIGYLVTCKHVWDYFYTSNFSVGVRLWCFVASTITFRYLIFNHHWATAFALNNSFFVPFPSWPPLSPSQDIHTWPSSGHTRNALLKAYLRVFLFLRTYMWGKWALSFFHLILCSGLFFNLLGHPFLFFLSEDRQFFCRITHLVPCLLFQNPQILLRVICVLRLVHCEANWQFYFLRHFLLVFGIKQSSLISILCLIAIASRIIKWSPTPLLIFRVPTSSPKTSLY